VCPRGGGKERKRLYEEGLTAGAVTAAMVVAMEEERGTLSATRVYYYYYCCFYCYCRETERRGCRKSEREGGMFPVLEDGGTVGIYFPPPLPLPPLLHPCIVPPTDRLPGWTTTTTTMTTTTMTTMKTTCYLSRSLRTPFQQHRSFSEQEYISPLRSSNSIPG